MRILDAFRDWLSDAEEKEKFVKHFFEKHPKIRNDNASEWAPSISYEVAKMQALLDEHVRDLKKLQNQIDALPKA